MASARYAYVKDLGEGSFGKVVLATDRETGEQVAIKKLVSAARQVPPLQLGLAPRQRCTYRC
jgi:serine/threonine protein kinase